MSFTADQLYALLPATFRTRDAEIGSPLKAFLTVISDQGAILEENIRQLYDDEFIETCAPWVIPYIGSLVGADAIYEIAGAATTGRRAEVANTIGYRRRKGTLLALEQVAMDVSGRPAAAVESFRRLITTESMHRIRPHHGATADLRRGDHLAALGTAFDKLNRTVDVRRISPRLRPHPSPDPTPLAIDLHGGGRFNIPDVAVWLWRWISFPITNAPAFRIDDRRWMFSPLGQDAPLFNAPAPRASFDHLTTPLDVPQPISRRDLFASPSSFYGRDKSIALYLDGDLVDIRRICCRDLSSGPGSPLWSCAPAGKIAIDPALGRIELGPDLPPPTDLRVTFSYGFPAPIGGGPYDRSASLSGLEDSSFDLTAVVGSPETPTFADAVAAWHLLPPGTSGRIILPDFESHTLPPGLSITVPANSRLSLLSARLHISPENDLSFSFNNSRAVLFGDIEIHGTEALTADGEEQPAGEILLNGLWIAGSLNLLDAPVNLSLSDCTLVPGLTLTPGGAPLYGGEPSIRSYAPGSDISLLRSITGPLALTPGGTARICGSIVDATSPCCPAFAGLDLVSEGADLHIEDSTVIGKVHAHSIELASDTIFFARRASHDPWPAPVWCSRRQTGCMRFCSVPAGSLTPRRFRCLPDLDSREGLLSPKFITVQYGHPSFCLLSTDVPVAVWTGAANGSQIGVYNQIAETEAVRNAELRTPQYLPFGLETGVFLEPSTSATLRHVPFPSAYGIPPAVGCCGEDAQDEVAYIGIGASLL